MSDPIVKLLLEQHEPDLLDTLDRAVGARLGPAEMQALEGAVRTRLTDALRRAYEMGYREALAARARAETARSPVAVLAEESVGFAAAPPPSASPPNEPRDEGAERNIAEMRALATNFGGEAQPTEAVKVEKADLSLFGEELPDEVEDDAGEDAALPPSIIEEEEEEAATASSSDSAPDSLLWDDEDDDADDAAETGEGSGKTRIRRTNAELAQISEQVFAYIKANPGTKARAGFDALGLDGLDWRGAAKRLAKAGRIFYAGATTARMYFALEETKRGRPKKLTKTAFILALPFDLPAAEVAASARSVGLTFDDRYVHGVRASDRRRVKTEAAEARAKLITERTAVIVSSPREPEGYRELRRAYTQARRSDGIWLACQALVTLGSAEDSEQVFYETRRAESAAHAKAPLSAELFARHVRHSGADPRATMVIDYLLPALIERYGRPTAAQGYTDAHRPDPAHHSLLSQTLVYAGRVLGVALPPIYQHATAPLAIFAIHGDVPSIGLGAYAPAFADGRDAAFVAANHLSYFIPGHYARRLVPVEQELRRWVDSAFALSRGATQFEHLSHLEQSMLQTQVDPDERIIIARETEGLDPRDINIAAWFHAVDATADRLGLLLCHDLERALHILRGGQPTGDDATEARVDALRTWSVGEDYLAVRTALGIGVE
jgi:hypothetical protein